MRPSHLFAFFTLSSLALTTWAGCGGDASDVPLGQSRQAGTGVMQPAAGAGGAKGADVVTTVGTAGAGGTPKNDGTAGAGGTKPDIGTVDPAGVCAAQDAKVQKPTGTPTCSADAPLFGVVWDGTQCRYLGGTSGCDKCVGADCGALADVKTIEACQQKHASCTAKPACAAQDAVAKKDPNDSQICTQSIRDLGWKWDGSACVNVTGNDGCYDCSGSDCTVVTQATKASCEQQHAACKN